VGSLAIGKAAQFGEYAMSNDVIKSTVGATQTILGAAATTLASSVEEARVDVSRREAQAAAAAESKLAAEVNNPINVALPPGVPPGTAVPVAAPSTAPAAPVAAAQAPAAGAAVPPAGPAAPASAPPTAAEAPDAHDATQFGII